THEAYIGQVVQLAKHYKRSPDQLTHDEVQAYLAYLIQERKLSWSTWSQARPCLPLPLPRHARPFAHGVPRPGSPATPAPARDPEPRGSVASARGLPPYLAPPPALDHLRRGPAGQRGRRAQGHRPRYRPHDRPRPAGQGDEGSLRATRPAPAARLPRLLEDQSSRHLALPQSAAHAPHRHHRGPEDLHHGKAPRRYPQAGRHSRPASRLRHALARSAHRRPRHRAAPARPPAHLHHDALLPSQPATHDG